MWIKKKKKRLVKPKKKNPRPQETQTRRKMEAATGCDGWAPSVNA